MCTKTVLASFRISPHNFFDGLSPELRVTFLLLSLAVTKHSGLQILEREKKKDAENVERDIEEDVREEEGKDQILVV